MSDYWCLAPPPPIITCLSSGCCCSGKNCRTAGNWTAPLRLLFSGPSNPPREQTLPGSVSHTCQGLQHKGMHAEAGCISRLTASHFTGARLLHSMSGMGNFDGEGATKHFYSWGAAVVCESAYPHTYSNLNIYIVEISLIYRHISTLVYIRQTVKHN